MLRILMMVVATSTILSAASWAAPDTVDESLGNVVLTKRTHHLNAEDCINSYDGERCLVNVARVKGYEMVVTSSRQSINVKSKDGKSGCQMELTPFRAGQTLGYIISSCASMPLSKARWFINDLVNKAKPVHFYVYSDN